MLLSFTAVYDSTFPHALGYLAAVPLARGDGIDMEDVHGIDFLEASVLRLDEEEVYDEEQCRTAAGENKSVEVIDGISDEPGTDLQSAIAK